MFQAYEGKVDQIIQDAKDAGVTTIVNTGTSIKSSREAVELAQKFENLYAIVGIHPHHADKIDAEFEGFIEDDWFGKLETLAQQPKVIGIGEIGMDYFMYKSNGVVDKKTQEDAFRRQIDLSIKYKLPLQIHNRLAWDDTLGILLEYKNKLQDPPGMFHCFSGNIEFTKKVLDAGFYLGFDGNITYKGVPPGEETELSELVKFAPVDRIFTETDAPFLTPIPKRGEQNTPANIPIIARYIAQLRGIEYNELEAQIHKNFMDLFHVS
jgi:TatD DNase family protein